MELPPTEDDVEALPDEGFEPPSDVDFALAPIAAPSSARRRVMIAITLVLVAALVVLAAIEGSGLIIRSEPIAPPAPSAPVAPVAAAAARIAVVDSAGTLSSMGADGSAVVTYPAPGVTFQFPTWSPDGTRIAAIATDGLGASAGVDVWAATGGSAAVPTVVYQQPDHPAFYAYWAPDGKALAFLTNEPNGIALRRAVADASEPDTTVRNGAPMYWQWVDPTTLLVHSGGGLPAAFLGEVGLTGAPANPTTLPGGPFRAPGLSGTGTYIAYATSGEGEVASVVVESRDGATRHEVKVFGGAAFEFDPVGDTLAFAAADKAGTAAQLPVGPLRIIDPVSGTIRVLLGGSIVTFFWSPDGRTIAALRLNGPGDTNVALRPDALATLARAGSGSRGAAGPAGAAGGAGGAGASGSAGGVGAAGGAGAPAAQTAVGLAVAVAFVDVATGAVRSERAAKVSDLFLNQVMPYYDQYALSHRFWSPDSTSILLPLEDDQGVSQLTIIPADGTEPHQLTTGDLGTWSP
ncbi:MAG: TolB protein [Chloroflexota bacterium]|nr:TolB protein [Chloroflexota bacterium]